MTPSRNNPANHPLISDRDLGRIRKMIWGMMATIKANMMRYDKNATYKTYASMQMYEEINGNDLEFGIQSERAPLIEGMETGRRGGKVPNGFYYIILQWSMDKGISFPTERDRRTFAYFVSKKIAEEGTVQYRQGINPNIYSNVYGLYNKKIQEQVVANINQNIRLWADDYLNQTKK